MIAIKGMKMPTDCFSCRITVQDCHVAMFREDRRADGCPLVEIVTCKDCKHCCHITDTPKVLLCEKHNCQQVSKNFYCADGERRE